jgi:hypothetical protein
MFCPTELKRGCSGAFLRLTPVVRGSGTTALGKAESGRSKMDDAVVERASPDKRDSGGDFLDLKVGSDDRAPKFRHSRMRMTPQILMNI